MVKRVSTHPTGAELKRHLRNGKTWSRGLFMLLFAAIYGLAEIVLIAIALFQFGAMLLTGRVNPRLLDFGRDLATYIRQMVLFFTYNGETKPFPFAPWPGAGNRSKPTDAARQSA